MSDRPPYNDPSPSQAERPVTQSECGRRHAANKNDIVSLGQKIDKVQEAITGNVEGTVPGLRQELKDHAGQIKAISRTLDHQNVQLNKIETSIAETKTLVKEACDQRKEFADIAAATAARTATNDAKAASGHKPLSKYKIVLFTGSGAGIGILLMQILDALYHRLVAIFPSLGG